MGGSFEKIIDEFEEQRKAKKVKRDRLSTGIEKLDEYLKGGIPQGSWIFIAGEPGTDKTIMCLHIAYANLKEGINVIYVTTEQPFRDLIEQAVQFKLNLNEYATGKDRLLHVIDMFKLYRHAWELKKE